MQKESSLNDERGSKQKPPRFSRQSLLVRSFLLLSFLVAMVIIPMVSQISTTQSIQQISSERSQGSSSYGDDFIITQMNHLNKTHESLKEQMRVMNDKVDLNAINREANANLQVKIKSLTEKMDELGNDFKAMKNEMEQGVETMKNEMEQDVKAMKNEIEAIKLLRGQSTKGENVAVEESQDPKNDFNQNNLDASNNDSRSNHCSDYPFSLWPIMEITEPPSSFTRKENTSLPCSHVFRPVHYFDTVGSPGYPYKRRHFDKLRAKINPASYKGMHWDTFQFISDSGDDNHSNEPVRELHWLYNSIPKGGSTTIDKALQNFNKYMMQNAVDEERSDGLSFKATHNGMLKRKKAKTVLDMAQTNWTSLTRGVVVEHDEEDSGIATFSPSEYKLFGIMREPVSRFVSATAQEFYLKTGGRKAVLFREKCLKDTPRETLQCAIDHVRTRFIDGERLSRIHFIPAAYIFYIRMFGRDLPIELVEFDELSRVLDQLGDANLKLNNHESEKKTGGDDVIANLSVSEMSEEMIEEVCALYVVDVLMMKHLGMKDPYCGGVVSTKYFAED